ncbi:MAG: hypothetical protein MJ054_00505 [Clostridia bacterium]|nr:hypothetical protein [Clostridia bacterium]
MNKTAISKTLLTIRPGLDEYATMLGERAHTHALCSCNTPNYTTHIIDKIIDLNVKQQTIHNLSERLKHEIAKLSPSTQAVINSYYRTYGIAQNIAEQAKQLGIAERTFYRHLDRATEFINTHLSQIGINFFTWQDLLHHHNWIKETFMRQCQLNPWQTTEHQKELNR